MSTRLYVAGEVVVGDEAGERQDVGERRPVAEALEVGLERDAGAAHRVAALAADGDDGQVALVLGDLLGGEPDRVRVERRRRGRGRVVIEDDQALAALAPGQERVVLAAEDGREVGEDLVDLLGCTAATASVASWARLSFDAATNCIARVICLMFRTARDPPPDLALAGHWLSARKLSRNVVDRLVEGRRRARRSGPCVSPSSSRTVGRSVSRNR